MHHLAPGHTTIDAVRVRGARVDALTARWAVTPALASLEPRLPAHWPLTAIVRVRRLRDPLPGRWRTPRWRDVARAALESLVARAARPAREVVSSEVEAVVFFDQPELLACLARDLAAGDAGRWWWRSFVGARSPREAVLSAWSDAPETLPPTLEALAARGRLAPALAALAPLPTADLLARVCHAHAVAPGALARLAARVAAARGEPAPHDPVPRASSSGTHTSLLAAGDVARVLALADRAGVELRALPREQATLVALSLAVRGGRGARALLGEPAAVTSPAPPGHVDTPVREAETATDGTPEAVASRHATHGGDTAAARHRAVAPAGDTLHATETATSLAAPEAPSRVVEASTDAAPAPGMWDERAAEASTFEALRTAYGGVFYLVNVLLAMERYPDFTAPLRASFEVPLWGCVAWLARALLGDGARPDDAVWGLLARLDGDPGDDAYASHQASLTALAYEVRARLEAALPTVPPDALAALALVHDARIDLTSTRVDVTLSLQALPIELRMAGIDRDAGWLPSVARGLYFHFE